MFRRMMRSAPTALSALALLVVACGGQVAQSASPPPPSPSATSSPGEPSATTAPASASPSVAASGWQAAGSMVFARLGFRSALLKDGTVLVVGNEACVAAGEPTGSERAELYDPETDSWSEVGSLNKERANPALTPLADGGAMVLGGTNPDSQPYSSTKVYSPSDRSWSDGPLMQRAGATAAVTLADGSVLAVGRGRAEILERGGASWRRATPLPTSLIPERLLILSTGDVVAFTGLVDGSGGDAALMRLEARDGTWESVEAPAVLRPVPVAIADGSMLALGDDEGGGHVQRFDPRTGTWEEPAQLATGRTRAQITVLRDGRVLVAGGVQLISEPVEGGYSVQEGAPLDSTEIYDPTTNAWSPGPSLLSPRQDGHAITLADGSVLLFGGYVETPPDDPNPDTGTPGPCASPLATTERLPAAP